MLFTVRDLNGAPMINLPAVLCLQLTIICLVLFVLRKNPGKLAKSIRSVLLPVAIGQLAVLLLTVVFQLSANQSLIKADDWLNDFYARHYRWLEVPPLVFAGIVIALILLDFFFRRARLVSRFLILEGYLHFVTAVLAAFAGFTFAAQHPYSLGPDRDAKVMPRSKSPKKAVETQQLNLVAAEILKNVFQAMPPDKLSAYADFVRRVDKDRWTQHQDEFRSSIDSLLSDDVPPPDAADQEKSARADATPDGSAAGEAWLGLYKILNKAFSERVPLPEGTLGELAKSLVETLSEKLWMRGYRSPSGERFQAVVEKISVWLAPRLEAVGETPVKAEVDVMDEVYKTRREASGSLTIDRTFIRERRESPLRAIIQERIRERVDPDRAEEK
jgi:hypothetical protein